MVADKVTTVAELLYKITETGNEQVIGEKSPIAPIVIASLSFTKVIVLKLLRLG